MKPAKLKLLPGLKWRGKLTVIGTHERGYIVDFDAEVVSGGPDSFVMDRAVLTPKQLKDWTGWGAPNNA